MIRCCLDANNFCSLRSGIYQTSCGIQLMSGGGTIPAEKHRRRLTLEGPPLTPGPAVAESILSSGLSGGQVKPSTYLVSNPFLPPKMGTGQMLSY